MRAPPGARPFRVHQESAIGLATSIALCTGLLGLFIAIPLLASARQRPANFWLGLFVFSVSWLSLAVFYWRYPLWLFGVFDWPLGLLGPAYYLYVRRLTGIGNSRRQAIHFIVPGIWAALLLVVRLLFDGATLRAWLIGSGGPVFGAILLGAELLVVAYTLASLWRLQQFRRRVHAAYSSIRQRDLRWLDVLSLALIVMLIIWIPANLFGGAWGWALFVGRLLVLYILGWYGLRQGTLQLSLQAEDSAAPAHSAPAAPEPDPPDEAGKYARSGMNQASSELIGARLARRESAARDFLENELTLADLARRIGTSPQLLSQYLNHVRGESFFDYINGLRVREVQRLMRLPGHAERPLLELAHSAGFNSKSTFNASFKKSAGMAPSQWRRAHGGTSGQIGTDAP